MNSTRKYIGTFEVTSGKMFVSDPCYKRGTWCAGVLDSVRIGMWKAIILCSDENDWGIRVKNLRVQHESVRCLRDLRKFRATFKVGVDSGQAGFFDDDCFHPDDSDWYDICCRTTDPRRAAMAGVIDGGAVSLSGYGDGSYNCYYYTDENGEIVAAVVWFF